MKKIIIVAIFLPLYTTFGNEAYKSCPVVEDFLQQQEQALKAFLQKQKEDRDAFLQKQEKDIKHGDYDGWSLPDIDLKQAGELYTFLQEQEDDLDAFIYKQQIERNAFFGKDTPLSCPVIDNETQNPFDFSYPKEDDPQINTKADMPDD